MRKKSKTGIVILLLIIIAIIVYLIYIYKDDGKTENMVNATNNTATNTSVENNVENEIGSNVVEQNKTPEENQNNENKNTEIATEDEKEVAMSIAKEAWGDTDGVFFQMEETQKPNGDYIISVSADAKVLAWYYVNAQARTYTVEYN